MSKIEETNSLPQIFSEANKLVATLESSEDKLFELKNSLEQKQTSVERLEQYDKDENMSIARKQAELTNLNREVNMADMQNAKLRGEGKEAYDSCQEAYQYINDIESNFGECDDKFKDLGNNSNGETVQYEKQIDDLIKLLDQLTKKRTKKLESLQTQEKEILEESLDVEKQLLADEIQDEYLVHDEADSELEVLENELKELQSKLCVLNDVHCGVNNEENNCENASVEFTEKYSETKYAELEKRFCDVNSEASEITKNFENQKDKERELSNSARVLEEHEAKLNREIRETSKFWNNLEQDPYKGFSDVEQEIGKIKADIFERNEKYNMLEDDDANCLEQIQQENKKIGETSTLIDQLASEISDMENVFKDLKRSTYISGQYDNITKDIEKLQKEKENLNQTFVKTEDDIEKITTQLKVEKDKGESELLAIKNNNLMQAEVTGFEKDCAASEVAKTDLEKKLQDVENEIKALEEIKDKQKEKEAQVAIRQQDEHKARLESQTTLNNIKTKKEKLKAKQGIVAAPSPIFLKAKDDNFVKPNIKETRRMKKLHKPSTVAKRNWDSDSSMEGEVVQLSDLLKKKHRKVPHEEERK